MAQRYGPIAAHTRRRASVLALYKTYVCIPILVTTFPPSGSAVRNHCRTHPAPCVRPRCVCSVLRAHAQFCRFDTLRRTLPPTFSDTAITDRHSDTTIFQLRAHWVRISWSIGWEKIVRTCAAGGSRTLDFLRATLSNVCVFQFS